MSIQPLGVAPLVGLLELDIPASTVSQTERSGSSGMAWLLEMDPLYREIGTVTTEAPGLSGIGPCGLAGMAQPFAIVREAPQPAPTRRYVSLAQGMMTRAGDTPPDTYIEPRVRGADIRIRRELPATGDRLSGFVAATAATIELDGGDGVLDAMITHEVMRDRPVALKQAPTTRLARGIEQPPALAEFVSVFAGRCTDIRIDADDRVRVLIADDFSRLDRPIQQRTYAGTGDREGGEALTGMPVPLAYGSAAGHEPTLVDELKVIFQVHDGEFRSIAIHSRGELIPVVRDVSTYEELAALTVEGEVDSPDIMAGYAVTCQAQGYFRLGGAAIGPITCDVEGDGINDGLRLYRGNRGYRGDRGYREKGRLTYRRYCGGILYRILTTRAGFQPSEIDIDRITQFDFERPFPLGISIPSSQRPTIREVCTRFADSLGAVILRNHVGQLFLRVLSGPVGGSQIKVKKNPDSSTDGVERMALPWGAPWHTVKLRCSPRFRPLSSDEASALLSPEESASFQRAYATVQASNNSLALLLPDRPILEIDTLLVSADHAKVVARGILNFYRQIDALYRYTARGIGFRTDVLSTIVLDYPRHGLNGGKALLVLSIDEQPGVNSTMLTLAG